MAELAVAEPRSEVASQTLEAVAREIAASLGEARVALETHVEQPDNALLLPRCESELLQVQGVLRVLEIHGAALLAEEMRQVAHYLRVSAADRKNQAEALDALMRAMVQLPSYLERVLAGGRDLALVLLPLLNDMRAVRGCALLSEGTLLLLNLKSDRQAAPEAPAAGEEGITVVQWSRKLRARFQVGLIGWIRGERIEQNLDILGHVSGRLEQIATSQAVFQLWWVVGAVIEALRERGLDGGVSIKRLLGLADREIKRLYEEGEVRYNQNPPVELLNNLLYYVARAGSAGPRVSAVRASFRLAELLPVDESIEQERENLSAPSVKLMQTVAAAIREDLAKIKDVLDIFVRRGGAAPEELVPQVDLLRKIGDTLGVLGLGEQRARVQGEISRLERLIAAKERPADSELVDIAATLIRIEDRLDDDLVGMILPRKAGSTSPAVDVDFQQVQSAVLRECVVNLARVKEYVAQNVGGTLDAAGFDNWQELMRGIQAGLLMLGKSRAVHSLDRITGHLRAVMHSGSGLSTEALDRLADSIVSVEYYMETLQAGRTDPWYMLDNAEASLHAVDTAPGRPVPTVAPVTPADYEHTLLIPHTATAIISTGRHPVPPVLAPAITPTAHVLAPPDPELLGLFLEEAREEVTRIEQRLPIWDQNPLEEDALLTVRRAFHTLKGSGRMVGARDLAEFAWAIENLINRLVDKTISRSPAILATLRDAVRALPQLVVQLAGGGLPYTDTAAIAMRAHALAAGRSPDPVAASQTVRSIDVTPIDFDEFLAPTAAQPIIKPEAFKSEVAEPEQAAPEQVEPDITLRDIYARETDSHVSAVRSWIQREARQPGPHVLPEPVYRACHTLAGSSRMADARHGTRLAEPLNNWLRKAFDSGVGLATPELALLSDCMTAMEAVSRNLDESSGFFSAHDALRARIVQAEADLDRRIAESQSGISPINRMPSPAAAPASEPDSAMDYDPEIAAIFSEEATELIEASERSLSQVGPQGGNLEELADLKRPLHTLKGGARMAGVTAMSDLAHELESLITQIEVGRVPFNAQARAALQAALDGLARMRELLAAGRPVGAAQPLIAQLQSLDEPAHEPGPAPEPVVDLALEPTGEFLAELIFEPPADRALAPERGAFGEVAPGAATFPAAPAPDFSALLKMPADEQLIATDAALPGELQAPAAAYQEPPPFGSYSFDAPTETPAEAPTIITSQPLVAPPPPPAAEVTLATALVPPGREPSVPADRPELARVDADLLNQLLNHAGEVSIGRSRVEQQLGSVEFNLGELSRTVTRLKEQLRKLEIETETQILNRHESEGSHRGDFDPLELDRYSSIQQFSRALAETANDVASIQQLLESLTQETQNLLQQQGRTITELQNGLMRTRMVSFQRHVQRLSRIVRQAAADTGKHAELIVEGATGELDRQVLERMLPPFEHMLRNAVVHGIETPAQRAALGKPETGQVRLVLRREGAEVIVDIHDDGAGMNLQAIRDKGYALGLVKSGQQLSDEDAMQLVLEPGFSTASSLTQSAGRGIGMDVVATEVKKLGGALHMETVAGQGSHFTIRLPFTLAVSHALVVRIGDEFYALPLPTVEGVVRLARSEVATHLASETASYSYGGHKYRFQHLGVFVGLEPGPLPEQDVTLPVVLVRAGDHSTGLVTEELIGSREIVVKSVGPQISAIRGISGATILGDGRIVVILDINALVRAEWRGRTSYTVPREKSDRRVVALVVDDSITVRRVTQRLLERNGMRVLTARDGMDAIGVLQENTPDIILLDIEMPRMDGYEVAAQVRADPRLKDIPIIMITSRVGEKHRARAIELGVDDYLGKPYQESQLLDAIAPLVAHRVEALGLAHP